MKHQSHLPDAEKVYMSSTYYSKYTLLEFNSNIKLPPVTANCLNQKSTSYMSSAGYSLGDAISYNDQEKRGSYLAGAPSFRLEELEAYIVTFNQ